MKFSKVTPYGKAKIYSVTANQTDVKRVLVVPGYSETLAHNKKLVEALAANGMDAYTYSQPRKAVNQRYPKKEESIQRQGSVLYEILAATTTNEDKVELVAHSLGSAAVLKAARDMPERVSGITLMQPVGLAGEQSFVEQLGRVNKKTTLNQVGALRGQNPNRTSKRGYTARRDAESAVRFSGRVARAQMASGGVIAKQPVLAVEEAMAAGHYDITEDIKAVRRLGIPVNIVTSHADEMYDHEKVANGFQNIAESASSISEVADANARHDTFWMQPERTARIVRQLIRYS